MRVTVSAGGEGSEWRRQICQKRKRKETIGEREREG
ncbi:hypothetical protein OIU76_023881 [Salix suchowensis]|nr:hypothetical protein OIU76_023881 [Salix suchowensis]